MWVRWSPEEGIVEETPEQVQARGLADDWRRHEFMSQIDYVNFFLHNSDKNIASRLQ